MNINPNIFKAYDIRGIYKKDFAEDFAYKLGLAYAYLRQKEEEDRKLKIVVGSDMRLSSPPLKRELIRGLLDGGVNVVDIGLSPTPTFYFAVAYFGYDGGVLVSASHNPKEYNGFKLVRNKALPIGKNTGIMDLKQIILENRFQKSNTPGSLGKRDDCIKEQIKHDLKYVDLDKIKKFKIVIDPANAMGSLYFDELFKYVSAEVVRMNWELDGTFPAHEADPFKYENIKDLCERVRKERADLGIATDGDGDRIFFVDDQGNPVEAGITRAILCKIFLRENPGSKIAYDIRPGKITEDIIRENGGIPIVTKVGHSLIKEQTIKEGAVFAGESSGHFFLNMEHGCYEVPVIVALKILEELSVSNLNFSQYIKPYKRYFHSGEINNRVNDPQKIISLIKERYHDGKINELDGITVEYPDYWFNVRASNTEPLLRLNVEAKSKEVLKQKTKELLKTIKEED